MILKYRFIYFLKQVLLFCLSCLIAVNTTANISHSQSAPFVHHAYIDCVGTDSNLGIRGYSSRQVIQQEMTTEFFKDMEISGYEALFIPGDNKSRVRVGFVDTQGSKISNQFVQIGPLKKQAYYTFPCYKGGACVVMTQEEGNLVKEIKATGKKSFPGCP